MPLSPDPSAPLSCPTLASSPAFIDSKPLDGIAPCAADAAEPTCADTELTNLAKGLVDSAILNEFSYYTLFIIDKICYYINSWRTPN
jgi:hypothetical protein